MSSERANEALALKTANHSCWHLSRRNAGRALSVLTLIGLFVLLLPSAFAQQVEAESASRAEDWAYIQNEHLRVGLLRSHGGAIAHLSTLGSDFNVLNHYDHGRLIQQSYYGDADDSMWAEKPWRYNPVQGGDYKGHGGKIIEFKTDGNSAHVKSIPRHWASGELLDECTMEQWVELNGPMLEVRFQFTYNGRDAHQPRHQETPAIFVSPKLSTLVTYAGESPWSGGALTKKVPGWPNEPVVLSENWAAYVGDDGEGMGVYVPGSSEATSYRFMGGSGSDCSYIAPLRTFALVPKLSFSYRAFFTLGDVDTIRQRFTALHRSQR